MSGESLKLQAHLVVGEEGSTALSDGPYSLSLQQKEKSILTLKHEQSSVVIHDQKLQHPEIMLEVNKNGAHAVCTSDDAGLEVRADVGSISGAEGKGGAKKLLRVNGVAATFSSTSNEVCKYQSTQSVNSYIQSDMETELILSKGGVWNVNWQEKEQHSLIGDEINVKTIYPSGWTVQLDSQDAVRADLGITTSSSE